MNVDVEGPRVDINSVPVVEAITPKTKAGVDYYPASYYGAILRKKVDPKIFKPVPSHLIYLAAHIAVVAGTFYALVFMQVLWPFKIILSVLMGFSFGLMGFIGHEIMHGSVTRNKTLQAIFSHISLTPYLGSPTFWKFWHNKLHHGNTQALIQDPDAFPTLRIYKYSKFMKFMYPYTPGSGTLRSYAYFLFWFCFNFIVAQVYFRYRNKIYEGVNHKRVNIEFASQVAVYLAFMGSAVYFGGLQNLFWVWLLPFMVQNYTIMSYVSTNHNLSPLTSVNDPLSNSVTVTNFKPLEYLHVNFGYHVEHHLFPTVCSKHAKVLHKAIKEEWPDKFQVTTKWRAMVDLYKTPRIYKNSTTLINPKTMKTYPVKDYSPKNLSTN